jgi:asparagine synthase (glutamine-hydrolysing)
LTAIAAVLPWNGRAAAPLVETLLSWQQRRVPSGARVFDEQPAALGSACPLAAAGTPESARAYADIEPACLVFDGCLDDRESLVSALGTDRGGAAASDAALALAAFDRWGIAGLERLTGDFALVLWDRRARTLVAARDLFGQRPLYYRLVEHAIAIASEVQALVRMSPVAVNEGMVAEFLSARTTSASETLYRDIHRVPPGHALAARDGGLTIVKLGGLEAPAELLRGADECANQFRELLRSAVRDRLRPADGIGVLLSGGMDSSSILATIREAEGGAAATPALACTLGSGGDPYDESPFAREVTARLGGPAIVIEPTPDYDFAAEVAETLLPPTNPAAALIAPLRHAASESGVRVMLTGVGADEWFGGTCWHYFDLLRRGRFIEAARRRLEAWRHAQPVGLVTIARAVAWDATPPSMQRRIRRALAPWLYPAWLDGGFVERVGLAARPRWKPAPEAATLAQRSMWRDALSAVQIEQSEEQARFAARFGQEDRQPYCDRRLVRFALSLPETERSARGVTKIVQRRAFADRLPESVIRRTSFFDCSFYEADAVARFAGAGLFRQSRLAARGWIREPALLSASDRALNAYRAYGRQHAGEAAALWSVVALELWYRGVEHNLSN